MLKRKMIRDIKNHFSEYLTVFLMILIGLMAYSGIKAYMIGMQVSGDELYSSGNLQDLDAYGLYTKEDIDYVKNLNNVKGAEGSLTFVSSVKGHKNHELEVNFIDSNKIDKFYVIDGEGFDFNKDGIWLDSYYGALNDIKVGDEVSLEFSSVTISKKVAGLINSPDHIYFTKDESVVFPTHDDYGFAYISMKFIPEQIFINELTDKGYDEDMARNYYKDNKDSLMRYTSIRITVLKDEEKVKSEVEKMENTSFVFNIFDEKSAKGLQDEIDEGKAYVGVFSGLFIFIAILSVITTMNRVVRRERVQIGTLKALGFTKRKITFHYMSYGLFLSILGAVVGMLLGYFFIGNLFLNMEAEYFELPNVHPGIDSSVLMMGLIVIILIEAAIFISTFSILKEAPADTLRPLRPKVNIRKIDGTKFLDFLPFSVKWNLRDMLRNKIRVIMGIIGVSGCTVLLVIGFGMFDTIDSYLDMQFNKLYSFKYKISIEDSSYYKKLEDKYGSKSSLSKLITVNDKIDTNLYVDDSDGLVSFFDSNRNKMKLNDNGVYVTRKFAENNGLKVGDKIHLSFTGSSLEADTKIIGLDYDPQNQNVKMSRKYYEKLGFEYVPDSIYSNDDINTKDKVIGVSSIQSIDSIKEGAEKMIGNMREMIVLIVFLASILGAVIIYNVGMLSLGEKIYQFATLKVLGFGNGKIKKIYTLQNIWIGVISVIIGLPLGYYVLDFVFKGALAEEYDFPAFVSAQSYVISLIFTMIVVILTSLLLSRNIKKIDMVESLKGED